MPCLPAILKFAERTVANTGISDIAWLYSSEFIGLHDDIDPIVMISTIDVLFLLLLVNMMSLVLIMYMYNELVFVTTCLNSDC